MGAEGAVNILFRRQVAAARDPEAMRQSMIESYREEIGSDVAAAHGMIDDIIDPRETRRMILRTLKLTRNKTVSRPWKKHGVNPV